MLRVPVNFPKSVDITPESVRKYFETTKELPVRDVVRKETIGVLKRFAWNGGNLYAMFDNNDPNVLSYLMYGSKSICLMPVTQPGIGLVSVAYAYVRDRQDGDGSILARASGDADDAR